MTIVARRKVEDCLDGSAVFDYEVSEPWTAGNVRCLSSLGDLEYYADFPRPLFRLRTRDGLFANGLAGATTCRVILPRANRETVERRWADTIATQNLPPVPPGTPSKPNLNQPIAESL